MAEQTKIEWCHHTFNPWLGCQKVSPGCDNCYAEGWAKRSGLVKWGPGEKRIRTSDAYWKQPLKWDAAAKRADVRAKVFCASLADVFDNAVSPAWRADLWRLIQATKHLDWLLLTKRPQNIAKMLPANEWEDGWSNVWLGTTAENQEEANRRIPHLLAAPAAKRFLSCEPLSGPVGLSPWLGGEKITLSIGSHWTEKTGDVSDIDWVICGGESGPKARPMHPDWARSLRDQCHAAGVAFHFKQWGEWTPGENVKRQRGTVPVAHWFDEKWDFGSEDLALEGTHIEYEHDLYRVGKKAAGALLDGREWREFPA